MNKGFTLLETLFVLMIVTVIITITANYGYYSYHRALSRQQVYQVILDIQKIESYSLFSPATFTIVANSNNYHLIYKKQGKFVQENKSLDKDSQFQVDKSKSLFFKQGKISQAYTIIIKRKDVVYHIICQMEFGRIRYYEIQ